MATPLGRHVVGPVVALLFRLLMLEITLTHRCTKHTARISRRADPVASATVHAWLMLAAMTGVCLLPSLASAQSIFPVRSSARAAGPGVGTNITVTGRVDARCKLTLTSAVQNIPVSMINDEGRLDGPAFQSAIITALNQAGLRGWCSGANNQLVLTRTPFVLGTTGTPLNGFARAALFDVSVTVATPSQAYSDTTQDGPSGSSPAGTFGPTGSGADFSFTAPSGSGGLTQPVAINTSDANSTAATASFTRLSNSRMVAGGYSSTVTLEVRPGL
jgi:hypothetical protein